MKTTTNLKHWENENGQCLCSDHVGNYLRMSISTYPKARTHSTPLGRWTLVPANEVQYMTDTYGGACETCVFGKGY
jgi:hypothetical protein